MSTQKKTTRLTRKIFLGFRFWTMWRNDRQSSFCAQRVGASWTITENSVMKSFKNFTLLSSMKLENEELTCVMQSKKHFENKIPGNLVITTSYLLCLLNVSKPSFWLQTQKHVLSSMVVALTRLAVFFADYVVDFWMWVYQFIECLAIRVVPFLCFWLRVFQIFTASLSRSASCAPWWEFNFYLHFLRVGQLLSLYQY